jgi:hypothetical protein
MHFEKARKLLAFVAIASIITGVIAIFGALLSAYYLHRFNFYALERPDLKINSELLRACKAFVYGTMPGMSVILIVSGVYTLQFLKELKKRAGAVPEVSSHPCESVSIRR